MIKEISNQASVIKTILDDHHIKYKLEYSFTDLIGKKKIPYRFDFALLDDDDNVICLIEYDSIIHFEKNSMFHDTSSDFRRAKERDRRKNRYCLSHGIKLIRIPCWELEGLTLDKILTTSKFVVKSIWHNDLLIIKK